MHYYLSTWWRWFRRCGYSRGFGVQSPSAYSFIRYVINEHYPYYAYQELQEQLPQLNNYHIYLMRNPSSKNKGLGFALAGNFYPDFLLWLVHKQTGKQYLTVIDPKGIRNMSVDDAKINLYKEIKTIEAQAGGDLVLNSFILSVTPFIEMVDKSVSADKLKERNVLFMLDNKQYLDDMFERILQS